MKPTLIIADDISEIREDLVKGLQADFDIVAEAENGITAVEACLRFRPDLVLLDVMMPKCTGIEAAIQLRAEMSPCPKIVILSGLTDPRLVKKAFEAGVSDYLFKPLDMKKIADTLWACARESEESAS